MRIGLWLLLTACARNIEGDVAGECEDGADNDRDGTFDCLDADCVGAPACLDDAPDTDQGTVDTPDDTPDPPQALCPTDVGWDGTGDRPPGPHDREIGRVTAWFILPDTWDQTYDANCRDTLDPDWAPVFDGAELQVPSTGFNYVFFRIQPDCTTAIKQNCQRGYPEGCVDDERNYTLDEPLWVADPESVEEALDPLLAPGCTIGIEQTPMVEDQGLTGTLTYARKILVSGACPANVSKNKNCTVSYTYDLEWAKAE